MSPVTATPPRAIGAIPDRRPALLFKQSHQLIFRQYHQAEHQMRHHLVRTAHSDVAPTKFILEPCVAALGHGALLVAHGVGRFKLFLQSAARVVVDRRNVAQTSAMLVQLLAAVRRVEHPYRFVTRAAVIVASGSAAGLSCTQARVRTALTGTPQSAVSMCS